MAILETKIIQVENDPTTINRSNEVWGQFGWNVQNIQITHSQNTKTYSSAWDQLGGNTSRTVETTTINYATITYQRDKGMNNYAQIADLDRQFNEAAAQLDALQRSESSTTGCFTWCLLFIIWPIGVGYLIYKLLNRAKRKKEEAENMEKIKDLRNRMQSLAESAAALL